MATTTLQANAPENTVSEPGKWSQRIDRIDAWCQRVGDAMNPILVKETRQALKSRQFVGTFSVLLFAGLAWTIIGSLWLMPGIYTSPSAPPMLVGYYLVLALPMLMVVPLAAYRSLEGEIDDGTLELLSITVLSPWQIVLGKLASAMLQMLLYFVALFPCVAYAYTLRGVDLPTTMLMMGILLVAGVLLTIVALFFAPLARTRTGRIVTLLAMMALLLAAEWVIGFMVISMILDGNPTSGDVLFFLVIATVAISAGLGHLFLTATAAQLTPESENRSTHIRVAMMVLTATVVGLAGVGVTLFGGANNGGGDELDLVLLMMGAMAMAGLWTVCAPMMVGESSIMTPRIRRELPKSFLARATLTWLTPGPASGLVFAIVNIVLVAAAFLITLDLLLAGRRNIGPAGIMSMFMQVTVCYTSYLVAFLVATRWLVAGVRIRNHPRVEVGLAAFVVVVAMSALIPYSIGLHYNDYRQYEYSTWQITNWVWTFGQIFELRNMWPTVIAIAGFAGASFLLTVLASPQLVVPRATATPQRVKDEQKNIATS